MSATRSQPAADRNLLFGVLALQMDFINRDALIRAMSAWVLDKARPLGQVLVEQGALRSDAHLLLEALVEKHLEMHGGDPQKSLAAVSTLGSVREQLQQVADPDLQASLGCVPVTRPPDQETPVTRDDSSDNGPTPAADPFGTRAPSGDTATPSVGVPTSSGLRFRILRPHARGGLGEVFVARDEELGREVALKEIQGRHAHHPDSRARFLLEAEITGGLEHPGIVPVYGLGHYGDGRPFYAMRFIRGDSLQDAIRRFHEAEKPGRDPGQRALELRQLLRRFVDVCNAIAYAHSRGVLHRDLKPGNIMLGQYGETLVVDWGLAKVTERPDKANGSVQEPIQPSSASGSAATQMGSALGTPQYMSPEQAAGRLDLLGPASDVYSLGATLYSLLTGQPPFEANDVGTVLQKVQRGDFKPPRQVKAGVPAALEAICLKAMALKPEDRYDSAQALADEVEHWLADEPVAAYREPWKVRAGRWVRRHRTAVTGVVATVLVAAVCLGAATVLLTAANQRERTAREEAQKQQERADQKARDETKARELAQQEKQRADTNADRAQKAKEQAERNASAAQKARVEAEQARAEAEKRRTESEWRLYASQIALAQREWQDNNVAHAHDLLDACRWDYRGWEHAYLRHLFDETQQTFRGHTSAVRSVAFSPDGKRLASGSTDYTVKVWEAATGQEILTLKGNTGWVNSVAFSPDGKRLASASGDLFQLGEVRVWDAATGQETLTLKGHTGPVWSVAFSPDGKRLASASDDHTVKVWEAQTGQETLTLKGHTSWVRSVAFSPDGKRLASASGDHTVKVWDAQTGQEVLSLGGHTSTVRSVAFNPDGKRLASGSADHTVKVWDPQTGQEVLTLWGHTDTVLSVAFSPDGKRLASGSGDLFQLGEVRVWDAATGQETLTLKGHTGPVWRVAFSPDGKRLASASDDQTLKVWDAQRGQEPLILKGHTNSVSSVAFSPDGKRLASASWDNTVKVWEAATGQEVLTLKGHILPVTSVCFSPDGKRLASASRDKTVKVWDAQTGQETLTLEGHTGDVWSVAFSPDGKRLASASWDKTVKVWEAATGQEVLTLKGHSSEVYSVAFSPDGKRLASASGDNTVKVWDAAKGQETLTLKGHTNTVLSVAFSPDGKRLASASADNTVKVWDAASNPVRATDKLRPEARRSPATSSLTPDHR